MVSLSLGRLHRYILHSISEDFSQEASTSRTEVQIKQEVELGSCEEKRSSESP